MKTYTLPEYGLRYVKERIIDFRREFNIIGNLIVTLPVDAETSLMYLQQHYSTVTFLLSNELKYGDLLIEESKVA